MEDFDQAIQDTIIVLNTGILRARDGQILKRTNGKALITNPVWREQLDTIEDMLVALRKRKQEHILYGAKANYRIYFVTRN